MWGRSRLRRASVNRPCSRRPARGHDRWPIFPQVLTPGSPPVEHVLLTPLRPRFCAPVSGVVEAVCDLETFNLH